MEQISCLTEDDCSKIISELDKFEWESGKDTAKGEAKLIKNNWQLTKATEGVGALINTTVNTVARNGTVFNAITYPRAVVGARFNKYNVGETYGWHVDYSHMDGMRTDISFTLFLTDPSRYDGGELQVDDGRGNVISTKGALGHAVVYPTGILHRVSPVTSGSRICLIGWVNSFVRSDTAREALVRLNKCKARIFNAKSQDEKDEAQKQLNYCYFQLVRELSDG